MNLEAFENVTKEFNLRYEKIIIGIILGKNKIIKYDKGKYREMFKEHFINKNGIRTFPYLCSCIP